MSRRWVPLLAAVVALPVAARAQVDLTGHYTATFKCKAIVEGVKTKFGGTGSAELTQIGGTNVALLHTSSSDPGGGDFHYQGVVQVDAKKGISGLATFTECSTRPNLESYNDVFSAKFVAKPTSANPAYAKLSIISPYATASPSSAGICKSKFIRVDTIDPVVGGCAPVCQPEG